MKINPDMDPLLQFRALFESQKSNTNSPLPGACTLSTTGLDGYPNARTVSLKEITNDGNDMVPPNNVISFENVSFSYDDSSEVPALNNINAKIYAFYFLQK